MMVKSRFIKNILYITTHTIIGAVQEYYGSGSGPIWLIGLKCYGNEYSLFDCGYQSNYEYGSFYCNHDNDVAIVCQGN